MMTMTRNYRGSEVVEAITGTNSCYVLYSGSWAAKWVLNVMAFLHNPRPILNYVPGMRFNNAILQSLHHLAWEAATWTRGTPPGFWVILVNRVWYSHCMTTVVRGVGRSAKLLNTSPNVSASVIIPLKIVESKAYLPNIQKVLHYFYDVENEFGIYIYSFIYLFMLNSYLIYLMLLFFIQLLIKRLQYNNLLQ